MRDVCFRRVEGGCVQYVNKALLLCQRCLDKTLDRQILLGVHEVLNQVNLFEKSTAMFELLSL